MATSSNHHYVRSIDIYPKCNEDILLAVGLANGRVALTTFGPSEYDINGYPGKEFGEYIAPKYTVSETAVNVFVCPSCYLKYQIYNLF